MAVNKQGLFSYDPTSGQLKNYFVEDGIQTTESDIVTFDFTEEGDLYLSLYFMGLFKADKDFKEVTRVCTDRILTDLEKDNIIEITHSQYNTLYLAGRDKGIYEYNSKQNTSSLLVANQANTWVTAFILDKSGRLWFTTSKGVKTYNPNNGDITEIIRRGVDGFDLSRGRPNAICIDSFDGIWVGTYFNGVNYSKASRRP